MGNKILENGFAESRRECANLDILHQAISIVVAQFCIIYLVKHVFAIVVPNVESGWILQSANKRESVVLGVEDVCSQQKTAEELSSAVS